ncbi:WD40-repeat-containing domain protein [Suillus subaureus]|uniref:WD40-repeat-containing domain protein n=1 Tax=Suillus subaureus TaxID=48587 RepID=A0A9P7E6F9_9AGAM|nr:WD40-repeat-containing domain protein [Suillus subaureus]KAG1812186.1 WD40-repeat-containing domain protein [Suillus subaureus]
MTTKEGMPRFMTIFWEGGPPTDIADRVNASYPYLLLKLMHQRVTKDIAQADKELLDGLRKRGFKTNLGDDDAGFLLTALNGGGGYYLDVGASQMIIDGKIKLKSDGPILRFTQTGLLFEDGSTLDADVVVFATGYADARHSYRALLSESLHDKLCPIWGLDKEGELNSIWREVGGRAKTGNSMDMYESLHTRPCTVDGSISHKVSGVPGSDTAASNALSGQIAQIMLGQPTPAHIMRGHTGAVWASAFFKDGRRVVTGSRNHTLRIWDVDKGTLVGGPFEGHENCVRSVAISPDDKRIASGGDDQTIIIWDVETKQKVFSLLVKHTGRVRSVCFSPSGKRLASGSNDFKVVIWDAETGASRWTKLASGSLDRTIKVWRTDNAELILQIAHQDGVRSVVWSPDGQQVVPALNDATVNFWNSSSGYRIGQPCTGHTDTIYSLAISPDGTFIATASADNTARLWSTKSHQQLGQSLKHTTTRVYCVATSYDGELLMSGDYSAKVQFWSIGPLSRHSYLLVRGIIMTLDCLTL